MHFQWGSCVLSVAGFAARLGSAASSASGVNKIMTHIERAGGGGRCAGQERERKGWCIPSGKASGAHAPMFLFFFFFLFLQCFFSCMTTHDYDFSFSVFSSASSHKYLCNSYKICSVLAIFLFLFIIYKFIFFVLLINIVYIRPPIAFFDSKKHVCICACTWRCSKSTIHNLSMQLQIDAHRRGLTN